ncbi:RIP metalloprotease RseP [Afifella sp. IM 167]|uniref:RIP metalloprotease RseP n=1 Tax=Afifella sp. IM 167 TaxID=2033586 RepID=UPI001CCA9A30|nr:RIP metalloprotease RseP [Afifella sp. IM 167]MBZ8132301.1 RIP metalloprotease RseP [Afifella sp. IM 167]
MLEFLTSTGGGLIGYAVPALIVLTVVVFIHELGHFLVARWCGIRVATFSIGFGRELFGFFDRRGTRWRVSLIPLGGYVKFVGDENGASIPDAEMLEETPPEERFGLFHFAPVWKRALVVVAGPVANFILAIVVFAAIFGFVGKPVTTPTVEVVNPGSAAEEAGFQPGDTILAIDGNAVSTFTDVQRVVALASGTELTFTVERGGSTVDLVATPRRQEIPDGLGSTQRVGVLGVSRSADMKLERYGPGGAVVEGVRETYTIIERTLTYVGRLFAGRETTDQLSGPLRVAQVSGIVAESGGAIGLIHLVGILSVSIGLLNLFPVPMLDGGHLVFYAIEAARGRPLGARAQEMGFRIGFALVIMLFVLVTFNDIVRMTGI